MKSKPSKIDQDDIALFKEEIGAIEHLDHNKIRPITNQPKPIPRFRQQRLEQDVDDTFSENYESRTVGSEETLNFRRSGIQHRLFSRLRTGQIQIEAELDLHGMTIPIAHESLAKFLHECQHNTIRCVRIIHGKGWGSKHHKPILKTKLNSWLQQEQDVLAFCSAPIEGGGTGAVYVLLRRTQKKK